MLPLISFETGRKTQTQSSGQHSKLRQQMEVWFSLREEPRLRGHRLSRQRSRSASSANFGEIQVPG
jgi:hypothetical protein